MASPTVKMVSAASSGTGRSTVKATVSRDGKEVEVAVTLVER